MMAIRVLSPKSSVVRNRSFLAPARFLSSDISRVTSLISKQIALWKRVCQMAEFPCAYHGFAWNIDGSLKRVPCSPHRATDLGRDLASSREFSTRTLSICRSCNAGLETTRKKTVTLATYQDSKIRAFHHTLSTWLETGSKP